MTNYPDPKKNEVISNSWKNKKLQKKGNVIQENFFTRRWTVHI